MRTEAGGLCRRQSGLWWVGRGLNVGEQQIQ